MSAMSALGCKAGSCSQTQVSLCNLGQILKSRKRDGGGELMRRYLEKLFASNELPAAPMKFKYSLTMV